MITSCKAKRATEARPDPEPLVSLADDYRYAGTSLFEVAVANPKTGKFIGFIDRRGFTFCMSSVGGFKQYEDAVARLESKAAKEQLKLGMILGIIKVEFSSRAVAWKMPPTKKAKTRRK